MSLHTNEQQMDQPTTDGSEQFRDSSQLCELPLSVVGDILPLAPISTESAIRRTSPTPQQGMSFLELVPQVEPVKINFGTLRPRPPSGTKKGSNLLKHLRNRDVLRMVLSSRPCQESGVDAWVKDNLPQYHGRAFVYISVPEGSDPVEFYFNSSPDPTDEAPLTLRWSIWTQRSQFQGIRARLDQVSSGSKIEIAPRSCKKNDANGINLRFENSTGESFNIGTVTLYSHQSHSDRSARSGEPTA